MLYSVCLHYYYRTKEKRWTVIDDKIESWVSNSDSIDDKDREFLVQFSDRKKDWSNSIESDS